MKKSVLGINDLSVEQNYFGSVDVYQYDNSFETTR